MLQAHFYPDDTVDIIETEGSVIKQKTITLHAFAKTLLEKIQFSTGMLPPGCSYYSRNGTMEGLVLESPPMIRKLKYLVPNVKDPHIYTVPCPPTVMIVKLNVHPDKKRTIATTWIYAAKGPLMSIRDVLFALPFANVYPDQRICWGDLDHQIYNSPYNSLVGLCSLIDYFYSLEFNQDLDGDRFEPIESMGSFGGKQVKIDILRTEGLFRHLDGKDIFPVDCLRPAITLEDALRGQRIL